MKTGDTVQTRGGMSLILVDRVLIDPTAHQLEPGWWASTNLDPETEFDFGPDAYFIGDDGCVYSNTTEWPDVYDWPVDRV